MAKSKYNRKKKSKNNGSGFLKFIFIIALIIGGIYLYKRWDGGVPFLEKQEGFEFSDIFGANGKSNGSSSEDDNSDESTSVSPTPASNVAHLVNTANITSIPAQQLWNVKMPSSIPSEMLNYTGMTISFNPNLHIPNWVAWELTDAETRGRLERSDNFMPDPNCRETAQLYDYKRSGYDRGHMCPAADARWDEKFMQEVFYMTNMCPQDHELNKGEWNNLEIKCREWARIDSAIIIITGPVLTDKLTKTIGPSKVAVPERFFKVILSPYANPPRAIGFVMANRNNPGGMEQNALSIDEVEAITGYDFFSILDDSIEDEIECVNDFPTWSKLRKNRKRY